MPARTILETPALSVVDYRCGVATLIVINAALWTSVYVLVRRGYKLKG